MDELLPTQDVNDIHDNNIETHEAIKPWGRLLPLTKFLSSIGKLTAYCDSSELTDMNYVFGRGEDCSFTFLSHMFEGTSQFSTISKKHFKISLEQSNNSTIVFIDDLSSNGTFVNGVKIGKGKRRPLNNNDELSISIKGIKSFIFSDTSYVDISFPKEIIDKYTVSKFLGRGAYGEVRLVFDQERCERYAMKIVQKKKFLMSSKMGQAFVHPVQAEVDILMRLNHPCIVQMYDVIDTTDYLYIVLELVEGGELFDRIVSLGHLSESDSKFFIYQVALAVKYLHHNGITHRDLKPENILLTSRSNQCLIKVTDFGVSKLVDESTMLRTFCGTPDYLAPEILKTAGCGTYTRAIDIWALGVVLYICLVGYPPFTKERTDYDLEAQIINGLYDFPDQFWGEINPNAIDLIRRMLTIDPCARCSIDVLGDPWLLDPYIQSEVSKLIARAQSNEAIYCREMNVNKNTSTDAPYDSVLTDKALLLKRPASDSEITMVNSKVRL